MSLDLISIIIIRAVNAVVGNYFLVNIKETSGLNRIDWEI